MAAVRTQGSAFSGMEITPRARNIGWPLIGALSRPVVSSSTLPPAAAMAAVSSRTMPGRSLPTTSTSSVRRWRASPRRTRATAWTVRPGMPGVCKLQQQGIGIGGRTLDAHDAGELPGQARHAAFQPVAAVPRHGIGEGSHKARAIAAEHGHDEVGLHVGTQAERAVNAKGNPRRIRRTPHLWGRKKPCSLRTESNPSTMASEHPFQTLFETLGTTSRSPMRNRSTATPLTFCTTCSACRWRNRAAASCCAHRAPATARPTCSRASSTNSAPPMSSFRCTPPSAARSMPPR